MITMTDVEIPMFIKTILLKLLFHTIYEVYIKTSLKICHYKPASILTFQTQVFKNFTENVKSKYIQALS